ncbi:MAG: adenylyltransferase/cytidyltransferase family protein [Candidatus Heimdallarchaeota archaeon]
MMIMHPAHLRFLLEARKTADCPECQLVVVLARDSSIERIKGHKPIFHELERLRLLSGLRVVDFARLGNEGSKHFDVILEINPDYIVLGYDQIQNDQPLQNFLTEHDLNTQLCRLPKFESGDLISSSEVRNKVLEMVTDKNNK